MSIFRTKDTYQEMCKNSELLHKLTDEERHRLQLHLCKMYKDLEALCDKHNLTMMMAFGSALGAIRHKGFIPWDDDMDIFMPRADYDQLIQVFAEEMPDNYVIYAPNSSNGAIARFAKLVDKNTCFVEVENETIDRHTGVFIDIFPLDAISTNVLRNKAKRLFSMALIYITSSVGHYQAHSKIYKSLMCNSLKGAFNYWFRNSIGFLFSFMSVQRWYNLVDVFCRNSSVTNYVDFVQSDYRWKPLECNLFFPPVRGEFEGMQVYLPHYPEEYLEIEFGDWKQIPPEGKRPEHYVVDFKI